MKPLSFPMAGLSILATPFTAYVLPIAVPESRELTQDSPLESGVVTTTAPLETNSTLPSSSISTVAASPSPTSTLSSSGGFSQKDITTVGIFAGVAVVLFIIGHTWYRKYHPKKAPPPSRTELRGCWAEYGDRNIINPHRGDLLACWERRGGGYRLARMPEPPSNAGGGGG